MKGHSPVPEKLMLGALPAPCRQPCSFRSAHTQGNPRAGGAPDQKLPLKKVQSEWQNSGGGGQEAPGKWQRRPMKTKAHPWEPMEGTPQGAPNPSPDGVPHFVLWLILHRMPMGRGQTG